MHGYELHHRLVDMGFWRISFGSVYPALRRLEKSGAIEAVAGTTRRKSYTITAAGRNHLTELLESQDADVDNSSAFRVRLSLFRHLPHAARIAILRRRESVLQRRIEAIEAALEDGHISDTYMRSEMQHRADVARNDIAWLEQLIANETTGGAPQAATEPRRSPSTTRSTR